MKKRKSKVFKSAVTGLVKKLNRYKSSVNPVFKTKKGNISRKMIANAITNLSTGKKVRSSKKFINEIFTNIFDLNYSQAKAVNANNVSRIKIGAKDFWKELKKNPNLAIKDVLADFEAKATGNLEHLSFVAAYLLGKVEFGKYGGITVTDFLSDEIIANAGDWLTYTEYLTRHGINLSEIYGS